MTRLLVQKILLAALPGALLVTPAFGDEIWLKRGNSVMVASDSHDASEAGLKILRNGGNAFDAAAAVSFALAVSRPHSTGLGGGGFLIGRKSDRGEVFVLDYRESAPKAATADMFRGDSSGLNSRLGYQAAAVPGQVAGIDLLLKRYGTQSMSLVIEPALRLARDGIKVDEHYVKACRKVLGDYQRFPSLKEWGDYVWRVHLREGRLRQPGDELKQPELAGLLEKLSQHGASFFYDGPVAGSFDRTMQKHGGIMTSADLGDYSVRRRTPLRLTYREYEVIAMPPPSSGGICLAQILNILEHFDLRDMRRKNSATAASMTIEAMKHAFADRARYLGDADFVDVPFERLMSKEYAKSLADKIKSPLPLGRYGTPTAGRSMEQIPADGGTSHFCIVDRLGNCVVSTETINTEFGSLAAIDEWGLILNNEMDDFTARPGEANAFGLIQSANNSIAPGKRPLSSMSPTMVLRNDQPVLLLGGSGGPRIISSVLQVMLNVVDYGDSLGEAVAARRFHHQWQPDCIFFDGEPDADLVRQLESMGYRVNDERREGVVQAIQIDGGRLTGASDPRKGGRPAGE